MDELRLHKFESELNYIYITLGATKKQRDAFYFGYVAGVEIAKKQHQHDSKTNLLGELPKAPSILLKRQLNQFFIRKGFTPKEKPHFRKGIEWGIASVRK
ncbi:hypothetical protein ACFVS2_25465 [Brevibacillus sp. NPDC058079]|uniref:hypothetical protein n=1 Tax=Brevibacillus sp. NPDC058079 TaxID=3346330 RepID=UPI0036EDC6BE